MNFYLFAAACLILIVGLIHSILGETLIFSRMRNNGFIPTAGDPVLKERHVRILWASWHLVTLFAWGLAFLVFKLSIATSDQNWFLDVERVILFAMLAGSALVLIGTRGRHPGWLGMLVIAILIALA